VAGRGRTADNQPCHESVQSTHVEGQVIEIDGQVVGPAVCLGETPLAGQLGHHGVVDRLVPGEQFDGAIDPWYGQGSRCLVRGSRGARYGRGGLRSTASIVARTTAF